jgi:hypothetical protein
LGDQRPLPFSSFSFFLLLGAIIIMVEFQEGFAGFIEGRRFVPYHNIMHIDTGTLYGKHVIYYRDKDGNIDYAVDADETRSLVDLLTLLHGKAVTNDSYDHSQSCYGY